MQISVIVPVLNEAGCIRTTLGDLAALRRQGHEIILVDGGSTDRTLELASPLVDRIVRCAPGRARQMNAGADAAAGELLWFLHADTRAPRRAIRHLLSVTHAETAPALWGFFRVRLSGDRFLLRVVERMMNLRSRRTAVATGDQGIFVTASLFRRAGRFPDLPLMEDVALSKCLRALQPPRCLPATLVTSSRRWEQRGIIRTILLMWALRLAWFAGVPAERLARHYAS